MQNLSLLLGLLVAFLPTLLLPAQTQPTQTVPSQQTPDKAMMAPVTALASYMANPNGTVLPSVFVGDGLVIVENFAPYVFRGNEVATRWDAAYRHHVARLKDLKYNFGDAHDFDRTGSRVYFVIPTTWRGIFPEGRFEEHGAWSFVLDEKSAGQWRIVAYTWGVTDETDSPVAP